MKKRHGVSSQRGMASIVITMVTMVVISLIVLGFAVVSRREARQSLDQLQSTQAFYAAETGVEDARKAIKTQIAAGLPVPDKTNCTTNDPGVTLYPTGNAMQVDSASNISYTCLQVDPSPESLEFDGVDGDSTVIPLTAASGSIRRVEITWTPTSTTGNPSVCPSDITDKFSPQSGTNAWQCGYGVLRVDVVPTDGALTRANLSTGSYGGFFQPVNYSATGSDNYAGNTGTPRLVAANCNTASYGSCKAIIDQLPGSTSASVRVSSMYQTSNVKVVAYNNNGVGGSPISLNGVQAKVDVTGKASDVLRRIQVRLPLVQTNTLFPGSAITSNGSICKRFETAPSYLSIPVIADADSSNAMCQPTTQGSL